MRRRWRWSAAVALVAAVLVVGPTHTADGPDVTLEAVEVPPPDRPSASEVGARIDTLAAVVRDMTDKEG